jgi:large subunit ribosomal protein L10
MMEKTTVSPAKKKEVERIKNLAEEYSVIGLANLSKVPAKALHDLRDQLRGDVVITMSKKTLIRKAFEQLGKENLVEFTNEIKGISALLFTDMNPIKLAQFLEAKAVKGPAKGGDIAPKQIEVKAGDTKLAPGPIISELNQHLNTPTMIKEGTIHIREDTITHEKGDLITDKQAQLLGRLGITPMEIKLDFYCAWEDGDILPYEVLHLDVEEILEETRLGASQAVNLALSLGLITEETVIPLMSRAIRSAFGVALELPIFIPDLLENYITKASAQANTLNATAFGLEVEEAPAPAESEPEESEEEKEEEEEEEDVGMGNLFG